MHRRHRKVLLRRQQQLLLRSAALRITLTAQGQVLRSPLAWVDRLRAGALWLGRHPVSLLAALALLVGYGPRPVLHSLPRLLAVSQLIPRAWHWLGRRSPRPA
ncbi:hypothetical protein GCM10027399_08180 [Curvibacter fontanus]|jgi:hypothetical protein